MCLLINPLLGSTVIISDIKKDGIIREWLQWRMIYSNKGSCKIEDHSMVMNGFKGLKLRIKSFQIAKSY